jgi:hypothetical protein
VASFLVRLAVMTPLWLAGMTVALGIAKVALGWPMVLVVIWLSWLVVEPAHRARRLGRSGGPNDAATGPADGAQADAVDGLSPRDPATR